MHAHARYEDSTPAKGEVLSASPSQVTITFTQDIQKVTGTYGIEVADEAGVNVTAGDAVINDADRTMMSVGLQPNLPPGRYVVQYENVSDADGDPWTGGFAFYVGVEPTAEQLAADAQLEPEDETPSPAATEPSSTQEPSGTPPASATAVPPNDDDDDGGGSTTWIILGAVMAVGVVAGFLGARVIAARRRA